LTHLPGGYLVHALVVGALLFLVSDPQGAGQRPDADSANEGPAATAPGLRATGKVDVSSADDDGDGLLEAAVVHVELEVLSAGEYSLSGTLEKNGRAVSHRPSWDSVRSSHTTFSAAPGIGRTSLAFSGEEIFRSGEDGPYDLRLVALGANGANVLEVRTPVVDHRKFGEIGASIMGAGETAVDEDGDGQFDSIRVTADVAVRVAGRYQLDASLSKGDTTLAYVSEFFSLTPGTQELDARVPGLSLLRSGWDGPYEGTVILHHERRGNLGGAHFITRAYASTAFEPFLQTDGRFRDRGIDTNGNGLLDLLRIELRAAVDKPGTYLLSGQIKSASSPLVVFGETRADLAQSPQTITLDFRGPLIHAQAIDGPYEVEIVARDPATHDELDRLRLGGQGSAREQAGLVQRTAAYRHTDFEPFGWAAIRVTGATSERGVDSDGNGLFEELRVEVEVELAKTDLYEWHATLTDASGTAIAWDRRRATLSAGKAAIDFGFDGKKIRQHGVDGPYSVGAMGMFGITGPNAVVLSVAQTRAYACSSFER
jgi:hypothetical protein